LIETMAHAAQASLTLNMQSRTTLN
jgi:hypothetical protein